ncbi:hypothetical protein HDE78_003607 [Rhodanobacter sp. K2T2]|uniref:CPBP family intramembrane glutamic endopeptidase n=1 Tax=Rhodanobacter sp. K2T2 TaxID=2723085 RepID=UPI0015CC28ED|nr:CPBP family intramembrane glutamic endopeptidase [Rhodanobacter sp. K2T2]NYE30632.1 hypothetical protein [Rhodanobacter sp. K2T2]
MSLWSVLQIIFKPWPYRLLLLAIAIAALFFLSKKNQIVEECTEIKAKSFGFTLSICAGLAASATALIIYVGLGCKTNPDPLVLEVWGAINWHFYIESVFFEIALALVVIALMRGRPWRSIWVAMPKTSFPLTLTIILLSYLSLHYVIRPFCSYILDAIKNNFYSDLNVNSISYLMPKEVAELKVISLELGRWGGVWILIWIGFIEPLIEEIFFRGVLFKALLERSSAMTAILIQAILFALLHLELSRILYLFLLGVFLGILVKKTSSLIPSMLVHILINTMAIYPIILH